MVSTFLFLCILSVYYWFFYHSSLAAEVVQRPSGSAPPEPVPHALQFRSEAPRQFHFAFNGRPVWTHTLPDDALTVHGDGIRVKDVCHGIPDGQSVLATGKPLYDHLNAHPDSESDVPFRQQSPFPIQTGNVFHFECSGGGVRGLRMCPSGSLFVRNACRPVDACTGKPDGTRMNHATIRSKYVVCRDEKETIHDCPDRHIFHHNRCEPTGNLTHYCREFSEPFRYNPRTFITCRNRKAYYTQCRKGFVYFDKKECEPDICLGLQDGAIQPLPDQTVQSFTFSPGYLTCRGGRVDSMVQCPQTWNAFASSSEDDLTLLPMVFDGRRCVVPVFCENVFSDDPDVVVPRHHFSKHLSNYFVSGILDRLDGHVCKEGRIRKRTRVPPGQIISKRFKMEPGCGPSMPPALPVFNDTHLYYDCATESVQMCPPGTFFNGTDCIDLPTHAFSFEQYPVFKFDSLNSESWIKPWNYSHEAKPTCRPPESDYVKRYNVCSHPDCTPYAFVSQIPDFKVLLPRDRRAHCQYDENEKVLKKTSVAFDYDFWNQRMVLEDEPPGNKGPACTPGQHIQTGNFIWDNTVFATCDMNQPFLFCPSVRSSGIFLADVKSNVYACAPPSEKRYTLEKAEGIPFEENEIKNIFPATNVPTLFRQHKNIPMDLVSPAGSQLIADGEKVSLEITHPVHIEPQYRVTYPPNVAFDYTRDPHVVRTSPSSHTFLVKLQNFTDKLVGLWKHRPVHYLT